MNRWYIEERVLDHWSPAVYRDRPDITDAMRIRRVGGTGPRVRAQPVEILETDRGKPLVDLQQIYGTQTLSGASQTMPLPGDAPTQREDA